MKLYLLFLLGAFAGADCPAQKTIFEKSNGTQSANYFEIISWYKTLAKKHGALKLIKRGMTDAGYPLHLAMLSADGTSNPDSWHKTGKLVIMVNNGIHPGEPDGIDASMMLMRDILEKKVVLPSNVALAFIPVYNIGGCLNRNSYTRANQNGPLEYGFRGNSQNLDLNRDFTKCDSREAMAFAETFHFLKPDILIDNHVSDGADFQHTMTLISTQYDKLGPSLGRFLKENLEPKIYSNMSAKGWEMIPYVDFGATDFSKGMRMFMDPPRYSSGYAALFNTLAFMPETHMLKPFKERVTATYDLMRVFIDEGGRAAKEIKIARAIANREWMTKIEYPLNWRPDSSVFSEITFKGYEPAFTKSEATGLQKMYYDHQQPFTKKIKFYHGYTPEVFVTKPNAYVIPQGWHRVVSLLKQNKILVRQLNNDTVIEVTAYAINDYKSSPVPYEKHHKNSRVVVLAKTIKARFLKGDFIINLAQPGARYLVEMLEPTGDDSFFAWNFFDAILQQKEGYSDYRWEDLAAEVLRKDPNLKAKLEEKKMRDANFAADSGAILDFIYTNSSYYEPAHRQYPVYRIEK